MRSSTASSTVLTPPSCRSVAEPPIRRRRERLTSMWPDAWLRDAAVSFPLHLLHGGSMRRPLLIGAATLAVTLPLTGTVTASAASTSGDRAGRSPEARVWLTTVD